MKLLGRVLLSVSFLLYLGCATKDKGKGGDSQPMSPNPEPTHQPGPAPGTPVPAPGTPVPTPGTPVPTPGTPVPSTTTNPPPPNQGQTTSESAPASGSRREGIDDDDRNPPLPINPHVDGSFVAGDHNATKTHFSWIQKAFKSVGHDPAKPPIATWWVRSIVETEDCPKIDGHAMDERFNSTLVVDDEKKFTDSPKLKVCEYELTHTGLVKVVYKESDGTFSDETLITPAKAKEGDLFLIGDTGRHYLTEAPIFKDIAEKMSTDSENKITVHLGDFIYSNQRNLYRITGNRNMVKETWSVWKEEFFIPAQKLLQKTPFVFTRGNHEECKEVGGFRGWFYFFDGKSGPVTAIDEAVCKTNYKIADSYLVNFGKTIIAVLDSAHAKSSSETPAETTKYSGELTHLNKQIIELKKQKENKTKKVLIATHRPFWGLIDRTIQTITLQKAYAEAFPKQPTDPAVKPLTNSDEKSSFDHILSGHTHLFDLLKFKAHRDISQIIVGNSGNDSQTATYSHIEPRAFNDRTRGDRHLLKDFSAGGTSVRYIENLSKPQDSIKERGYGILKIEKISEIRAGRTVNVLKTKIQSCTTACSEGYEADY